LKYLIHLNTPLVKKAPKGEQASGGLRLSVDGPDPAAILINDDLIRQGIILGQDISLKAVVFLRNLSQFQVGISRGF